MWPLTGVGTKVEVPQGGGGGGGDKEREARGNKTILSEMNTKQKQKNMHVAQIQIVKYDKCLSTSS